MRIYFYGAAKFVTGSNHLIETKNGEKFLLDMGLFQGSKQQEEMNFMDLPYDPSEIDFLLLSHAHIDHSGRIPKLVKEGFRGKIYCTPATRGLAEIMLKDSAHIQESDAEWENKKRERKGLAAIEALYTEDDVEAAMNLFDTHYYGEVFDVSPNIKVRFKDAGHILGSAIVEIWIKEDDSTAKLVFTGDLGVKGHTLIREPDFIEEADYLIMESTYGNSVHSKYSDSLEGLMQTIEDVTSDGGTVIIPSFAVGRTQEIIYELNKQYESKHGGAKNPIPFYVDSPLAVNATKVFMQNTSILHDEAQALIRKGDNIFEFPNLYYTKTIEESKELNANTSPKVIISASGMATGGRVVHHLKHNLWNPKNAVIFVGYQAQGTAGHIIKSGVESVKLAGEWIANKAQVYDMPGFSAHADKDYLMYWLGGYKRKPKRIFLVHGETDEMYPLKNLIESDLGISVDVPGLNSYVDLDFAHLENVNIFNSAEELRLREEEKLESKLYQVQLILDDLAKRDVNIGDLDAEKRAALFINLNEIEASLMDFNMISGK